MMIAQARPFRAAFSRDRARRMIERLPQGVWRVASSAGWLAAEHAVRLATGLLVGVWVARHLGPQAFGTLSYAISFVFLFSALGRLGLDNLVVRDLVADRAHEAEILSAALTLRIAGGILAFALIALAAFATQADPTTRLAILIVGVGLVFQSLEVSAYWFYARTSARPVAIARMCALAVVSALRVAFILLDKPVLWFAVPVALDAAIAATLLLAFYLRSHDSPGLRLRPRLHHLAAMLREAWPLALSIVLVELQLRIDQVMLGNMLSAEEVGWYAAAARLSQMLYAVPMLLATAAFPSVLRAREVSAELYERRMQSFHDVMLWLAMAIALPGTLFAAPIVHLLYGAAYAPSSSVLQIHLWSLVFVGLGVARGRWLIAEGMTRLTLVLSVVAVVANIAGNAILIPIHGGIGAAWATLLAQSAALLVFSSAQSRTRSYGRMAAGAVLAPLRWRRQLTLAASGTHNEASPS